MKTTKEWNKSGALRFSYPERDIAAIQADARQGMVPVEKVKELVEALEQINNHPDAAFTTIIPISDKALQTAKELGLTQPS